MRRIRLSFIVIGITLLLSAYLIGVPQENPVSARIVSVQRGDVHRIAAISGHIAYADESYAYAAVSGVVSRLYIQEGQRVAAGEALIRLSTGEREDVLAAFVASVPDQAAQMASALAEEQLSLQNTVVRAESSCVVRQVLVTENVPVAAGTPVLRLTSNEQRIVCSAVHTDAALINQGMWAWIYAEGEPVGHAEVIGIGEEAVNPITGCVSREVVLMPEQPLDVPEGAIVDVDVYLAGSDDVMTLPLEAVTERQTVWWVHDGRCTEIPAEIVMSDEILAWVRLPEGMQVAIGEFIEGQLIEEADA